MICKKKSRDVKHGLTLLQIFWFEMLLHYVLSKYANNYFPFQAKKNPEKLSYFEFWLTSHAGSIQPNLAAHINDVWWTTLYADFKKCFSLCPAVQTTTSENSITDTTSAWIFYHANRRLAEVVGGRFQVPLAKK